MSEDLHAVATALVARGKGILAADETPATLSRRFDAVGIPSNEQTRRTYRQILFSAPGAADFLGGAILQDETIHQQDDAAVPFAEVLARAGIIPGIKVDEGAKPLAGWPGETVTEGLDGLRERLADYRQLGARFAKWRAVLRIAEGLPSRACIEANAHALARYAALCQEQGLVPIVEPEVLMDGAHDLARSEAVTSEVLEEVFRQLFRQGVAPEGMLLKPNMVTAGADSPQKASVAEVAQATLRCLRRHVPAATPGIVFLSGGQSDKEATEHLNAISKLPGPKPWTISFSFARALQAEALKTWAGRDENRAAAAEALLHRARCNSAATLGEYTEDMERAGPKSSAPRRVA